MMHDVMKVVALCLLILCVPSITPRDVLMHGLHIWPAYGLCLLTGLLVAYGASSFINSNALTPYQWCGQLRVPTLLMMSLCHRHAK
jgi:hypothetical protein